MKKSKKLLLAILGVFVIATSITIAVSCSKDETVRDETDSIASKFNAGTVIGVDHGGGVYEITANQRDLAEIFGEMAREQGLGTVTYTTFEIKKMPYNTSPVTYYYALYAWDSSQLHKAMQGLVKQQSNFVADAAPSITCTSTQCPGAQCLPIRYHSNGAIVTSCSSCTNTCTKTASM